MSKHKLHRVTTFNYPRQKVNTQFAEAIASINKALVSLIQSHTQFNLNAKQDLYEKFDVCYASLKTAVGIADRLKKNIDVLKQLGEVAIKGLWRIDGKEIPITLIKLTEMRTYYDTASDEEALLAEHYFTNVYGDFIINSCEDIDTQTRYDTELEIYKEAYKIYCTVQSWEYNPDMRVYSFFSNDTPIVFNTEIDDSKGQ